MFGQLFSYLTSPTPSCWEVLPHTKWKQSDGISWDWMCSCMGKLSEMTWWSTSGSSWMGTPSRATAGCSPTAVGVSSRQSSLAMYPARRRWLWPGPPTHSLSPGISQWRLKAFINKPQLNLEFFLEMVMLFFFWALAWWFMVLSYTSQAIQEPFCVACLWLPNQWKGCYPGLCFGFRGFSPPLFLLVTGETHFLSLFLLWRFAFLQRIFTENMINGPQSSIIKQTNRCVSQSPDINRSLSSAPLSLVWLSSRGGQIAQFEFSVFFCTMKNFWKVAFCCIFFAQFALPIFILGNYTQAGSYYKHRRHALAQLTVAE